MIKKINIVCLMLLTMAISLSAQDLKPFEKGGFDELSLNGTWQFSVDSLLSRSDEWTQPSYQSSKWDQLPVPGNWDVENAYANFKGTGYYRKTFTVPSAWKGRKLRLCFGAVYQATEVWLNGNYLGKHVGGYTPFEFDISNVILPGGDNTIALSANNEYGAGAWWHWGGISREVKLVRNNEQRIVWQHIVAEPDLDNGGASVFASVKITNQSDQEFSGILTSNIRECASCERIEKEVTIPSHGEISANLTFELMPDEVKLWDFDNPHLYHLQTDLKTKNGDHPLHSSTDRFGIRKIEAREGKLLLNGQAVHLNGFNRVADHRAYGQTEPDHIVKFDIDAMKAMGCNFTRIMHYPQAVNLLDYCDEVGMLLIEEIPVWGKGNPEIIPDNPLTKQWLREMIERDYNHPSIVGWSVANEIADPDLEGRQMSPNVYNYVKTMIDYVYTLDSSRLKTYVSYTVGNAEKIGVDPADLCDIICFNSYGEAANIAKKCHALWPDKPIFVSEIGKGQVGLYPDTAVLAESLQSAIRNLENLDYVVGSSLWTYNDYRSRYPGTPASQNRAWGVYNVWRQPKRSAGQIQSLYASQTSREELPTMDELPDQASERAPTIWTVIPLDKSCMVGFSVGDEKDHYEIEYKNRQGKAKLLKIENLQGAAKIDNLPPGSYSIRIRRLMGTAAGPWSATRETMIK